MCVFGIESVGMFNKWKCIIGRFFILSTDVIGYQIGHVSDFDGAVLDLIEYWFYFAISYDIVHDL